MKFFILSTLLCLSTSVFADLNPPNMAVYCAILTPQPISVGSFVVLYQDGQNDFSAEVVDTLHMSTEQRRQVFIEGQANLFEQLPRLVPRQKVKIDRSQPGSVTAQGATIEITMDRRSLSDSIREHVLFEYPSHRATISFKQADGSIVSNDVPCIAVPKFEGVLFN